MDKKLLINGANGFLGTYVVKKAIEAGWNVRASDLAPQPSPELAKLEMEYVPADLLDLDEARKITFGTTHIINVAGLFRFDASKEALYKANASVTRNMCQAALEADVERFVQVATIGVYGRFPMDRPITEDHPKHPKNDYEKSKKKGEDIALRYFERYGLPVVSLRPSVIYGPRSRYPIALVIAMTAMMRALGIKESPSIEVPVKIQQVHVLDVAGALVHLLEHGRLGEAYHIADETPTYWSDLISFFRREFGMAEPKKYSIPRPVARAVGYGANLIPQRLLDRGSVKLAQAWEQMQRKYPVADVLKPQLDRDFFTYISSDHMFDTSKLINTGFRLEYPNAWDGLRETIDWYEDQGWIPNVRRRSKAA